MTAISYSIVLIAVLSLIIQTVSSCQTQRYEREDTYRRQPGKTTPTPQPDQTDDDPPGQDSISPGQQEKDLPPPWDPCWVDENDLNSKEASWPVPMNAELMQRFANPIKYQTCQFHTGIDVPGITGEPIAAFKKGKVIHMGPLWYAGKGQGRGPYSIVIQHGPAYFSTYGHNSRSLVAKGDCVQQGETIAEIGTLGYSSGPHLHFEIIRGIPFTGNWQIPFENVCPVKGDENQSHYKDPMDYTYPDRGN